MCGRLWVVAALQRLVQHANAGHVRNADRYSGTYNVGPTNFLPAIRRFTGSLASTSQKSQQYLAQSRQSQNTGDEHKNDETAPTTQGDPKSQEKVVQSTPNARSGDGNLPGDALDTEKLQDDRVLDFMEWGIKTQQHFVINVRVEGAEDKNMFKPYIDKNRCVVMAEGYYDWDQKKNAHSFKRKGQDFVLMAAIYTHEEKVMTMTRESVGDSGKVHHRMPVLLENDEEVEIWLDTDRYSYEEAISRIMRPDKTIWNDLAIQKVGPAVNNIREKSAKCIMSYEDYQKELDKNGIKRFFQPVQRKPDASAQSGTKNAQEQAPKAAQPDEKSTVNLKRRKLSDAEGDVQ